jgi:hypothetical protein
MYMTAFPDPLIDSRALAIAMRPWPELLSEEKAADTSRSLCLAHMDAYLKNRREALDFLGDDLSGRFARRGIEIECAAHAGDAEVASVSR